MLRIVFTGPESSGKTTLTQHLAAHYGAPWVPEYARVYLEKQLTGYTEADLTKIAEGQLYRENRISAGSPPLLLCDTDLLTIKIWSEYKYQRTAPWILEQIRERHYDYYFLCRPDVPWEADPLRENPHDREALYDRYRDELDALGKTYVEIGGSLTERMQKAIPLIDRWLRTACSPSP